MVDRVATPELRVPVPSVVLPSLKVTVPVAVLGLTVAVSTVAWAVVDGLTDELRAVDVLTLPLEAVTVSVTAEEVLPAYAPPPL